MHTFTYISDAHNTTSWINHFVSSFSVHQAMFNMDVLTEYILSDHRAVAVSIQCSHLPELDDEAMEPQPSRFTWMSPPRCATAQYQQAIVAVKSRSCALATFQNIGKTRK